MFSIVRAALIACTISLGSAPVSSADPISVKVGGYPFEPFVEGSVGVTPGFITLLNSSQGIYRFEFVEIPAQRRYEMMDSGKIDALFFEMIRWGWDEHDNIETTAPIIAGREVFVALKSNAMAEELVKQPTLHRMALTLGYHYSFANFNADQTYLRENFQVQFAEKQRVALRYLLTGQVDIALASELFLHHEYLRSPELRQQLLIANQVDQTYELPIMVRRGGPMDVAVMNRILDGLVDCDCLSSFFASYGLAELLVFPSR